MGRLDSMLQVSVPLLPSPHHTTFRGHVAWLVRMFRLSGYAITNDKTSREVDVYLARKQEQVVCFVARAKEGTVQFLIASGNGEPCATFRAVFQHRAEPVLDKSAANSGGQVGMLTLTLKDLEQIRSTDRHADQLVIRTDTTTPLPQIIEGRVRVKMPVMNNPMLS